MEIYNFHTDTKDENYLPHILNFTVNGKTYRNWAFRELFDEQVPILAKWDSLNKQRKIVGFSAVDTHENMNFRARQINKNQVEWLGPNADIIDTVNYNSFNRLFFHEPDANGWVFKYMIDTYETAFSYITNYVLADSLTTNSLGAHILNGHMYTAFKSLADAKGFFYYSVNSDSEIAGIMGDSVGVNTIVELKAVSPFPGKFRLLRNGEIIDQTDSGQYYYSYNTDAKKGAYRIEVWLKPGKKYLPWLYTNPIYIY
jgi:hypothetical protein